MCIRDSSSTSLTVRFSSRPAENPELEERLAESFLGGRDGGLPSRLVLCPLHVMHFFGDQPGKRARAASLTVNGRPHCTQLNSGIGTKRSSSGLWGQMPISASATPTA